MTTEMPPITRTELTFAQAWDKLSDMQRQSNILVADIPEVFQFDMNLYLISRAKNPVELPEIVSGALYCEWLLKVYRKGTYYSIQFATTPQP